MNGWPGTRVLVTGADGFIGSHLVERLVQAGARVRALVFYNSFSSWGWLEDTPADLRAAVDVTTGDIRDAQSTARVARGCEVVMHLAALNAIPYSYQAVESFVDTNVRGTMNVLSAALAGGARLVVQTSTSEVYGDARQVPINEDHPLQAQSPYAASKIAADKLAESFHRAFDLPVVIVRPFNCYGPRQSARAVIPTILAQLLSGAREVRLGALEPKRDFTFVTDTVDGFLKAAQCPALIGRVVQLGSGTEISVGQLLQVAARVLGREAHAVVEQERKRPAKSEVDRLLCDGSLARELLAWQPTVPLEEGIARTAAWLGANLHRYKTDRYNV